jgi:ATP-dependent Clp protease ATP-binding subunit ClpA
MFERFTERARQVVVLAQDEARLLRHNYIGTEHILLGLLREEEGLAARVLWSLEVTVEEVRAQVASIIGLGEGTPTGQIPFTPRAKRVLELSLAEALSLGHNYIGTEHILLGLVREDEGVAARILLDFDVDPDRVRGATLAMLSGVEAHREAAEPSDRPSFVRLTAPPFAQEFLDELERVQKEKEAAIEAQDFENAALWRDRERRLLLPAADLQQAWDNRPPA